MELKDVGIVFIVLCAGLAIGYLLSPEYISLEETERDSYEAQINNQKTMYEEKLVEWDTYAKDTNAHYTELCRLEKAETADRLAERNSELIEVNKGWQELFIDLNETISDFNRVLYDFNIMDLNCWR